MTPEKLREKGNRWRELGQYDLANIYNQHAAALEEIERLKGELANEVAIVNRIWTIYGSPDYEALNGRTIYDLINADRERAEKAERRAERLQAQMTILSAIGSDK